MFKAAQRRHSINRRLKPPVNKVTSLAGLSAMPNYYFNAIYNKKPPTIKKPFPAIIPEEPIR
jgi:hypothetical protein